MLFICHCASAVELTVTIYDYEKHKLKDIIVYLEGKDTKVVEKINKSVEISQFNRSFAPYISVVQTGNQVRFHNKDDITHHIYSPIGKNKFQFKILSGQQHEMDDFTSEGEIAMGCNIHDWMSGYLLVLDTPYFDKTNAQGVVSLSVKHKGNYQLTIWHPQLNESNNRMVQSITLDKNKHIEIRLTNAMDPLPMQKSEDDFDFLSDY